MTFERFRLNVGQNRSAGEALDEQLLREALTALEETYEYAKAVESRFAPYLASRPSRAKLPEGAEDLGKRVRNTITKLEERLLSE